MIHAAENASGERSRVSPPVPHFLGSTTNEVRSTESRELFSEGELSKDWDDNNIGTADGKQT